MELEIRNLTLVNRDGARLVDDLSLTLMPGRVTALIGASASGKSLTAMAVQGITPPGIRRLSGQVLVGGAPAQRGRDVATIMQNPRTAFNPVRTIRAHAVETARATGVDPAGFAPLLAEVGLDDPTLPDLYPFQLSGGMLQRVMIALALFSGAPFLIADEPTTDLDLVVQAQVLDLIARLARDRGLGILFITHDMGVIARLARTAHVMDAGRIVEEGPVARIFDAPAHAATRALVAAHLALYPEEVA